MVWVRLLGEVCQVKRKDSSAKKLQHFRKGLPLPKEEDSREGDKEGEQKRWTAFQEREWGQQYLSSQENKLKTKIFYVTDFEQFWRHAKDRNQTDVQ